MTFLETESSIDQHNEFVLRNGFGSHYQTSFYAETERPFGFTSYCWTDITDENADICAANLAKLKPIPHTPFFYAYLRMGFVMDYTRSDWHKLLTSLWTATLNVLKKHKVLYFKFDLPVTDDREDVYKFFTDKGCDHASLVQTNAPYTYFRFRAVLDISAPEDELLKSFSKTTRACIKKADKYGLRFEFGSLKDIGEYQKLKNETAERNKIWSHNLAQSTKLFGVLEQSGLGHLLFIKLVPGDTLRILRADWAQREKELAKLQSKNRVNEAQVQDVVWAMEKLKKQIQELEELEQTHPEGIYLSASIIIEHGRTLYYFLAGSSDNFRDYLPNYLMIWQIILWGKARGCERLDMGGTDPAEDESSLGEFKKRWGTETLAFSGDFDYVLQKPLGTLFKKLMKKRREESHA